MLGIYPLVRCDKIYQMPFNLICWLHWRNSVEISWRKLAISLSTKLTIRFTERKMFEEEKTELTFEEIVEDDSTKKVAALAFVSPLLCETD